MRIMRAVVALGLTASLLLACTKNQEPPPISAADVAQIEKALSGDKASQALALAPELRPHFEAQPEAALPKAAAVKINLATLKSQGDYGVAEADVTGAGRFLLFLQRQSGEWYIVHTQPAVPASPTRTITTYRFRPGLALVNYVVAEDCADVGARLLLSGTKSPGQFAGRDSNNYLQL